MTTFESLESRTLLAAEFVADLNPNTLASDPQQFVSLGDQAYFFAKTGAAEVFDLYRTDGTAGGTAVVREGMRKPRAMTAAGGRVYFWSVDDEHGEEPWVSDGTPAGTRILKDVNPGPNGSGRSDQPALFTEFGGRVYFPATAETGTELMVTDGTADGTVLSVDLLPGGSSRPREVVASGGRLFVLGYRTSSGSDGLWATDGTAAGTALLREFSQTHGARYHLTDFNGTAFFSALGSLWKSDGTPAGTSVVRSTNDTGHSLFPGEFTPVGGTLYFATQHNPNGSALPKQLWKTDGTPEGTVPVDATPAPDNVRGLTSLNGAVVFTAGPSTQSPSQPGDRELWRSDGTAAGTYLLKDVWPAVGSGLGQLEYVAFARVGSVLYFAGDDGVTGRELWKTDGTSEGTVRVADVQPGFRPSNPGGPLPPLGPLITPPAAWTAAGDRLVFSAAGASDDYEPWSSDGTAAGTVRLDDLNRLPRGSNPRNLAGLNGDVLVAGDIGPTQRALYRSDGTAAGTVSISEVAPAPVPLNLAAPNGGFAVIGGVAYYAGIAAGDATGASRDYLLYRTDGTPGGTVAVPGLRPRGGYPLPPNPVVAAGGTVYLTAIREALEMGLWRSDGTEGGTVRLTGYERPAAPSFQRDRSYARLTPVGGLVYFFDGIATASGLWRTDGTPEGTIELTSGLPILQPSYVTTAAVGNLLFVTPTNRGLMVSDGTVAGTRPVGNNFEAWEVVSFKGAAYFTVRDAHPTGGGSGPAIFRTDGTADGTSLVKLLPTGNIRYVPNGLSVVGDRLYFWADDGIHGHEPWVSDGTESGTMLLADINAGPAWSMPSHVSVFARQPAFAGRDDRAFFTASDGVHGMELWATDGTAAGTAMQGDIYPGPTGSDPGLPVFVGGDAFFAATDPAHGRELWKVTLPAAVAATHVFYNNSALDGRDPGPSAADDAAVAADKRPMLTGQPGRFAQSTSYARGINGVMVDIAGLPAGEVLSVDDFEFRALRVGGSWVGGQTPREVAVRRGAGASGSDRVTLVWDDFRQRGGAHAAVADGWLEVTVKANERTGLSAPYVFRIGNLRGDANGDARVDAGDLAGTRAAIRFALSSFDHNRDGRVNVLDHLLVRENLFNSLAPVEWDGTGASVSSSSAPARRRVAYGVF